MSKSLPKYRCHKEVRAAKIATIKTPTNGTGVLIFEDENLWRVTVSKEYMQKHQPYEGGYYVKYADGYESFSPADAFEEGYTLAED